jgi:subtilase family protein/VCBS repeat protein
MRSMRTPILFPAIAVVIAIAVTRSGRHVIAQQTPGVSSQVLGQISALSADKASRTPVQRKISSRLLYAARIARGEAIAQGVPILQINLPDVNNLGTVIDVRAQVSEPLLDELVRLGAELLDVSARYENIRLRVPLAQIEAIASLPQVVFMQPKQEAKTSRISSPLRSAGTAAAGDSIRTLRERKRSERAALIASVKSAFNQNGAITNVGSQNSEGDAKHRADAARAMFGTSGSGVKIGLLSDGVNGLIASQASGDLGPVTVLPGQAGSGAEGTAMLEIIHDIAPNAQLFFATAFGSMASFAQNIRDLRTAGCNIIVDDVGYFAETPFQDGQLGTSLTNGGIVIQAVKDVAAAGTLYFSAAGNEGNKNDGTSGTWEGDFIDGGNNLHNFGGQNFDVLISPGAGYPIALFWADPLGASSNDYDLYRLNSTGTTILDFSENVQNGTQDPWEIVSGGSAGDRIVIVKFSGASRFMHVATNGARLSISTAGETHGHAATSAPNSFGVAATSAQLNGLNPFNPGHVVETFSSDGPRRIFFQASGAAITPGNFTSTGGQILQKPDLTAADRVSVTGAGGFPSVFAGTSAAAPHAAAIAALIMSKNPALTTAQVRTALLASAIDIEAPGVDRDSGVGIVMADTAVALVPGPPPSITMHPANQTVRVGQTATFTIAASGATTYQWQASSNGGASFTNLPNAPPFGGVLTPTLTITNVGLGFNGILYRCVASNPYGSATSQAALLRLLIAPNRTDFDKDGKADLAVFRPSSSIWYINPSSGGYTTYQWGLSTDIPVPGDYDGDGRPDIAVYRPATGTWYVLLSSTTYTTFIAEQWGLSTDIPLTGDYDGDGKCDLALFRPSAGIWYIKLSSTNFATFKMIQWGLATDQPVTGDYDGDGIADVAIYRPSSGSWYALLSSTNYTDFTVRQWGLSTDVTATADFDGDGKTDFGVFRPSNGTWYVLLSGSNYTTFLIIQWGANGDILVPGDYDGDNRADLAVFRPSTGTWYVLLSGTNYSAFMAQQWGLGTDTPLRP